MNKNKLSLLAAALVTTLALSASATSSTIYGNVGWLSLGDGTSADSGMPDYQGQVFTMTASATGTTCKNQSIRGGGTMIRIPDNAAGDRMRALILAAWLAGKPFTVTVNDANKDTLGVCYAKGVRVPN